MKTGWETKCIGAALTLSYGKALPKSDRHELGRYPAYGANGIKCRTNRYHYAKPSIIVGRKGSAGEVTLAEAPFWPLDVAYFVEFDEQHYDHKFLYYLLSSLGLPKLARGVKPGINRNDVYEMALAFPPLVEQRRIAALLDEAFGRIDSAIRNLHRNLSSVGELFERYVNEALNPAGLTWPQKCIGIVAENLDSRRVPVTKSDRKFGDVPYYGASGIVDYVDGHIFDEDLLLVSEDGANLLARTYPIAFSISGKSWVNNHAHVLRFAHATEQRLVEYYLNSISLKPYVSGMAQPKLNQKALNSIRVPIPPKEDRSRVVTQLDFLAVECEQLRTKYENKLDTLIELKNSILQRALTGELTPEEAGTHVPAVA